MEGTFVPPGDISDDTRSQLPQDPRWSPDEQWAKVAPEEPQEAPEEPTEPINPDPYHGFDPAIKEAIVGLEHLGYLEEQFEFAGHSFVIRTLHPDEDAAAALAIQPYRGSLKEPEMWVTVQVAMALTSVDGDDNFCPPTGPDVNEFARGRLRYVASKWFFPLLEWIYVEQLEPLTLRAANAIQAFANLSTRNRSLSLPMFGSSIASGITPDSQG